MADRWFLRIAALSAATRRSETLWNGDRAARDAAIGEADALGIKLREIWRATGPIGARMSTSHVHRVMVIQAALRQAGRVPKATPRPSTSGKDLPAISA